MRRQAVADEDRLDNLRAEVTSPRVSWALKWVSPVLLALALAVRVTRVTAEVFVLKWGESWSAGQPTATGPTTPSAPAKALNLPDEHRKVEEHEASIAQLKSTVAQQEATIAQLKSGMEALTGTVREQATQIQKVSGQLQPSKPATQVVNNP
jgi:methyl-accepting chemotaxis protein